MSRITTTDVKVTNTIVATNLAIISTDIITGNTIFYANDGIANTYVSAETVVFYSNSTSNAAAFTVNINNYTQAVTLPSNFTLRVPGTPAASAPIFLTSPGAQAQGQGGGIVNTQYFTITGSNTWVNPQTDTINPYYSYYSGQETVLVMMLAGGGAGGGNSTSGSFGSGGGGGAGAIGWFTLGDFGGASVSLTIGAGGQTNGAAGGSTSFGNLVCYGGGGGSYSATGAYGGGGGGGGSRSAGSQGAAGTTALLAGGGAGGEPALSTVTIKSMGGANGMANGTATSDRWSIFGGGGGGGFNADGNCSNGGSSYFGGAGGGGAYGGASFCYTLEGTSLGSGAGGINNNTAQPGCGGVGTTAGSLCPGGNGMIIVYVIK